MNPRDRDVEPCFVISIAARMVGVHAQTLRYYERAGMVDPLRTSGNQRLYSTQDVARLRQIKTLVDDLGVNLAGVEIILRLTEQMAKMENQLAALQQRIKELSGEQEEEPER